MKKLFLLFIISVCVGSCYTAKQAAEDSKKNKTVTGNKTKWLVYSFQMTYPTLNKTMTFEDSIISITFDITRTQIDFSLKNNIKTIIKVGWDEASMVVYGNSNKIMHKGIKYADRNNSMASTTVLPESKLEDLALPTDNVYFNEATHGALVSLASSWETKPLLLPELKLPKDSAMLRTLNDQEITLYLPITGINNERYGYTFKFKVSSVQVQNRNPELKSKKPITIYKH